MSLVIDRITSGFVNGDHSLVVSLLSQVELLKDVRVERFSFPIRSIKMFCCLTWQFGTVGWILSVNVSQLNLTNSATRRAQIPS